MLFADKLSFDHPRKTADGYLVARARASRSGIYEYLGSEIDPKGEHVGANDTVRVYRSEDEVFAADSVASFLMKPVTNDHPSQPVTADNWRDYAKGVVGKALRDGDFLAFDIVLMDNATIAGPLCRIGDAATCDKLPGADLIAILTDERTYNPAPEGDKTADARRETSNSGGSQVATKTITFDGLPLEVTDAAEAAITKLLNQAKGLQDKLTAAEGDVARLTTDKTALDAKVATLEQQAKDAKLTPQQLRDAAKSFAAIVDKAKALGIEVKDDMDEPAIRKAAVSARLGDVAKDWTDEQIAVSFDTLAADVGDNRTDALRSTIASRPLVTADGSAVRDMARAAQYN
jgi:hypothetical protein